MGWRWSPRGRGEGNRQQESWEMPPRCKSSWRSPLALHRATDSRAGLPQAKQLTGREHHPTHQQIKALLSMAPPTRASPSFPHNQSLPSGSLHKPLSLIHQRADRRKKKSHNPTTVTAKTTVQKVNQDEKAELRPR